MSTISIGNKKKRNEDDKKKNKKKKKVVRKVSFEFFNAKGTMDNEKPENKPWIDFYKKHDHVKDFKTCLFDGCKEDGSNEPLVGAHVHRIVCKRKKGEKEQVAMWILQLCQSHNVISVLPT